MADGLPKPITAPVRWMRGRRPWLLVGLAMLLVLVIRVHLRNLPLERDEGEYALAGQFMLRGSVPYNHLYLFKLPGTYAAYALFMAILGQSPLAIHCGLALVNAGSILLMFLVARKLMDDSAAVAAAWSFALLSTSPSILGLQAHATHFVVLPVLAGTLLLLHWEKTRSNRTLWLSGLLFGVAVLMKQHGIFFGLFGAFYLLSTGVLGRLAANVEAQKKRLFSINVQSVGRVQPGKLAAEAPGWGQILAQLGLFGLGVVLPYLLLCLVLLQVGAFKQFVFWTVSYAARYAAAIPIVNGPELLKSALRTVVGPNLVLWLLPWIGALLMWWEERLSVKHRILLTSLTLLSLASVSLGFYFREHYFILLLPALSLLTGIAVSRGLYLLKHDTTIELFLAVPILGLFAIGAAAALIGNGAVWFAMSPVKAMETIYSSTLFPQTRAAADYIRDHASAETPIAVLGSEPEIYFYSARRPVTGHIYMYPLMEKHDFGSHLQDQLIGEIERRRPEYVVYVDDNFSWLENADSAPRLRQWWDGYSRTELDLVMTFDVRDLNETAGGDTKRNLNALKHLFIFKRKKAQPL